MLWVLEDNVTVLGNGFLLSFHPHNLFTISRTVLDRIDMSGKFFDILQS